jgi:NAD(P)-dependent dehydrogenase (short-subunit alcohol dehydrogenase family)
VRLFRTVDDELGPIRALVNNAGIVAGKARVDELTSARVEHLFAVNVVGPLLCAREAVRRMSTRHGGRGGSIVNVSSAASRLGSPGEYVDYAATKGAIDTMTLGLAAEVADEGIRVNAVRPGLVATGIHASGGQPDRIARLSPLIPMRRPGEPPEIATAIVWLCSDQASYVTGALLDVSGGR